MREIKVRFWDEVNHRFWYGEQEGESEAQETFQTYFENGRLIAVMWKPVSYGLKSVDDVIERELKGSEYTGLKDKNGKEIFEGDIVRISNHPFDGPIEVNRNYEVGYNSEMELCCGSWLLFRMRHYAEVIGNVFEHPELLEVKEAEKK
ncbi:YopX family protein [Aneurinibacillus migulanus]|uniref:YopX family protein n=1 Tax=Aneurinibacillus migulanus TaxID=47500 RepID=UPI002E1B3542|nr:YopX family protein [Aneurinibacillus migulanus]